MKDEFRIVPKKKMTYFLVDAGTNPINGLTWYDLIRAVDIEEAERISASRGYGEVISELGSNFRQSIGSLVYDSGYPTYSLKPIADKFPNN